MNIQMAGAENDPTVNRDVEVASASKLRVGSYRIGPGAAVSISYAFEGVGLNEPTGVVRVQQANFGRSGQVQFAMTFILRDRGSTVPIYGAVGFNTTIPESLPGEVADDRYGDYDGDGKTDVAVFRPSTGTWYVRGHAGIRYGQKGDIPVPGDYGGDGKTDIAIYRLSTGTWYIRGQRRLVYGSRYDRPAQSDYNGDGRTDIAVWSPSRGRTYIRGQHSVTLGHAGDQPVPAFYEDTYRSDGGTYGDARSNVALFDPTHGTWSINFESNQPSRFGNRGDIPVSGIWIHSGHPNDYRYQLAVFRPASGTWYFHTEYGLVSVKYGQRGDIPV